MSSGDNSNILAARVARETYGVDHVVARIYDPGRAEIYERLGIPTVATVRWAADQVMRRLVPQQAVTVHQDRTGSVSIVDMPVDAAWIGTRYRDLEAATGTRVAYVARTGTALLPREDLVHQDGDTVHLVLATRDVERVEAVLAAPPSSITGVRPASSGTASSGHAEAANPTTRRP